MNPFDFDERPFIVIWEATRACALACRHCRAEAMTRRDPLELNPEESLRCIEQVARCRPALFVLTGGDPVRRPDLITLIHHASAQGLRVGLSPSATPELVRQDFRALTDAGVARISLSVDGATAKSHDLFRGVPGTWALTMQAMAKAAAAGLPLQINTTFTRQNLGEFDAFADLLAERQPVLWSVFQLVPTGRGKRDDLLTAEEMEELFRRLYRFSLTAPFEIKTTEGQHYRRVVRQQAKGQPVPVQRAPPGVNDGKGFIFISHTGDIQPSGFLPLTAGNVRRDELGDIYRHSALFRELRNPNLLRGKCGVCEFRSICGGSRARAYAMTGDYLGEEPLCNYQPRRSGRREEENSSSTAAEVSDNQSPLRWAAT
jgi:AdoMet-dependent heme synthase